MGQAQTDKLKVNWAERRKTNIIPTGGCPITRFNHTSLHKQGTAAHQTPLCTPRVSTSNASACAWQTTRARRPHGGTTAREARQGGVFLREGGQQKRQEATQEGEALGETGAAETGSRRCAHSCSGVAINEDVSSGSKPSSLKRDTVRTVRAVFVGGASCPAHGRSATQRSVSAQWLVVPRRGRDYIQTWSST